MHRSCTYIFSVTCVFEGSLNDVIMAQHATSESYSQVKGKSVVLHHFIHCGHLCLIAIFTSVLAPRMDF